MKSVKYTGRYSYTSLFRYIDEITKISYGIQNIGNIIIGYRYKNQTKGFWLTKIKE